MEELTVAEADRLELWLHTDYDDVTEIREQLDRLVTEGVVETVTIRYWRHEMVLMDDQRTHRQSSRERVVEFKEWARDNGEELLGFEDCTVGIGRMGPEFEVEQRPPVTLAEYDGEELVGVTPCADRAGSVVERLNQLEHPG